nr:putative ribonuclease H-like domain-containing protein [Tanacetum cinerariifolium]
MRPFGCLITIFNTINHLDKFDGKADEGFFVGYSLNSKAFRVFNSRTRIVEENLHISFSKNTPDIVGNGPDWIFDIDALTRIMNYEPIVAGTQANGFADPKSSHNYGSKPSSDNRKKVDADPKKCEDQEKEDNVNNTNNVNAAGTNEDNKLLFDPNMPALKDEELLQFKLQEVWTLVELLNGKRAIGTKLVFRNKKDERGIMIRNKARLVAQGYTQEGIDYDEVFAHVARIKAIRLKKMCMYVNYQDLKIQTFLIEYTRLKKHCMEYIKLLEPDDVIFGSTKKELCNAFERFIEVKTASTPIETQKPLLKDEGGEELDVHMYRSMIGSLMYLTSLRPDIMFVVRDCARYQVNPKVSHLHDVKRNFRFLKGQPKLGLWYPKDSPFDLVAYIDSDYVGVSLDRKSTTGGCRFLGLLLVILNTDELLLLVILNTVRHTLTTAGSKLMLLGITYYCRLKVNTFRHNLLLLDGKKVIITEASIRRDLHLADGEGVDCLPNTTIFEQLALMGKPTRKVNQVPQPSDPIEHVADEAIHKELGDSLVRAATTASSLEAEKYSGKINKTQYKATPNEPSSYETDSSGGPSDKDRLELDELMALCTNLQTRVLDLEKTKTSQGNEIASLKKRVKKLEKKNRSRTHKLKRLYKVDLTARVESSDEESSGEDASKQERRINAIDQDEDITMVNVQDDTKMFDVADLDGEEVLFAEQEVVSTATTTITRRARSELVEGKQKRVGEELIQESEKKQKERIVGIKSLLDAVGITVAQVFVKTALINAAEELQ